MDDAPPPDLAPTTPPLSEAAREVLLDDLADLLWLQDVGTRTKAREVADRLRRAVVEALAPASVADSRDTEQVAASGEVGDAPHLPTLRDIVWRLPDGSDYDDGLEDTEGAYLGGWVGYREDLHDPATGTSSGELVVSTDAPALVDHGLISVPGAQPVVLRRFRLTLTEIPREAS